MSDLFLLFKRWQEAGWLRQLDWALARFIQQQGEQEPMLVLSAALLSYQVGRGHVCINLSALLNEPFATLGINPTDAPELSSQLNCSVEQMTQTLMASAVVEEGAGSSPLVLANDNLYLRRYWQFEQSIGQSLLIRMKTDRLPDMAVLTESLNALFPDQNATEINWQKLACANAVRSNFSVITGGPGTGKTFTVVRLLALLHKLSERPPRIMLAAPTGKAAARLKSSILEALAAMKSDTELAAWRPILEHIEGESSTLHRLLGSLPDTRAFRHNRDNPLAADVLIIDEASMVDIELMAAVVSALPVTARLILLGDKDQLASVEAGAIMGQLCEGAEETCYRPQTFEFLQAVAGSQRIPARYLNPTAATRLQYLTMLRVSRRFDDSSGIGQLAVAINTRSHADVTGILSGAGGDWPDLQYLNPASAYDHAFKALCQRGFSDYLALVQEGPNEVDELDSWARQVLHAYSRFQLLTPLRSGDWGLQRLNELVAGWVQADSFNEHWYDGRPVMITSNDYSLNLRNGDIGIVLPVDADGTKRVVFIDGDDQLRWIQPSRLTQVTTVYAMTIHKSQGSEFNHTVVVLPERDNPVLSKELLYTAVTRARSQLTLVVPQPQLLKVITARKVSRVGGLLV